MNLIILFFSLEGFYFALLRCSNHPGQMLKEISGGTIAGYDQPIGAGKLISVDTSTNVSI